MLAPGTTAASEQGDRPMDVDSLRKELEEHLKKNPDKSAPSGFRDRFDSALEQMAADDGVPDETWEAQLERITAEAEAAHECMHNESDVPDNERRTEPAGGGDSPLVEQGTGEAARPPTADAENQLTGLLRRFRLPLGVAAIALAAAYFAFRT